MHPTADTIVVMLRERLGAAGDAGRYAYNETYLFHGDMLRDTRVGLLRHG